MFNPMYMPLKSLGPIASKGINWAGILSTTQKTLNIVNQAIPLVYQAKPIINNAKTMFKLANEFSKNNINDNNTNNNSIKKEVSKNNYIEDDNQPSFFI